MKLTVTEFVSLDGVSQGPGAPDEDLSEGFTRGGWLVPHIDEAFISRASAWLDGADALLFGRRTYTNFAHDWPEITDPDDPFTERMNRLPKYVVSNTLTHANWAPTTIIAGNIRAQISGLKRQDGGELQIHGSARLAQSLLAAGLVDELRLVIAPVVVGSGRRLLPQDGPATGLRLVENDRTPAGLSIHVFRVQGSPSFAGYEGSAQYAR